MSYREVPRTIVAPGTEARGEGDDERSEVDIRDELGLLNEKLETLQARKRSLEAELKRRGA